MSRISSLRSSTLTPVAFFQVAGLGRRQVVVEDDDVGVRCGRQVLELLDFALAQIGRHVGRLPPLSQLAHDRSRRWLPILAAPRAGLRGILDAEAELPPEWPPRWPRSQCDSFLSRAINSSKVMRTISPRYHTLFGQAGIAANAVDRRTSGIRPKPVQVAIASYPHYKFRSQPDNRMSRRVRHSISPAIKWQ